MTSRDPSLARIHGMSSEIAGLLSDYIQTFYTKPYDIYHRGVFIEAAISRMGDLAVETGKLSYLVSVTRNRVDEEDAKANAL